VVDFAQIEAAMTRNCMSTKGFCSIFEIRKCTFYEWKRKGIPVNSKLLPMLRMFIDNPVQFIKRHADEFKED